MQVPGGHLAPGSGFRPHAEIAEDPNSRGAIVFKYCSSKISCYIVFSYCGIRVFKYCSISCYIQVYFRIVVLWQLYYSIIVGILSSIGAKDPGTLNASTLNPFASGLVQSPEHHHNLMVLTREPLFPQRKLKHDPKPNPTP